MSMTAKTGEAPTGPADLEPTWASSATDLVTTALGASRIWASLVHGILNEGYWASTGATQIRGRELIVARHRGGRAVQRARR